MAKKIKLTIEEIVKDFEALIRHDERLNTILDMKKFSEEDIEDFHLEMIALMEKYLPTYREKVSREYFSEDATTLNKAMILYDDLHENFRHIFCQLFQN